MGKEKSGYRRETYRTIWKQYSLDRWGWKKKLKTTLYVKFLTLVMSRIMKEIIVNQYRYRMPFNMGEIYISKRKLKKRYLDFKATKETGITTWRDMRYMNGKIPYFRWDKTQTRLFTKKLLTFYPIDGWDHTEFPIGHTGLMRHVQDCHDDPYKKDYEILG